MADTAEDFLKEFGGDITEEQPATDSADVFLSEFGEALSDEPLVFPTHEIGGETALPTEQKPPPTIGEIATGVKETGATLLGGATLGSFGFVGGVFEGIIKEIASGEFGSQDAANRIQALANQRSAQFTRPFLPETETGKKFVQEVGEVFEQIPAFPPAVAEAQIIAQSTKASLPVLTQKLGRHIKLIDPQTGLPTKEMQAAMRNKGVDFSLFIEDAAKLPTVSNKVGASEIVDSVIVKKIKDGSGNKSLAKIKLDKKGGIIEDLLGVKAEKQGFRPGDIASAKNSNIQTRNAMAEMLEMKRQIHGDTSKSLEFRPSDIPGREVMKRFNFIRDKANDLNNELELIATGKAKRGKGRKGELIPLGRGLKGKAIDTGNINDNLIRELTDINVRLPEDVLQNTTKLKEFLASKDAFVGSDISKDGLSQAMIRDTVDLLAEPFEADALRAHRIKRQIDKMVDFRKTESPVLTEPGERVARSVRASLNNAVRDVSPSYAKVNDELSEMIGAMQSLTEPMPRKINVFSETGDAAVGQELRKILTNYNSRQQIREAISELDRVSAKYGGQLDTDVSKLVLFNNTLDDRFQATAVGSMQGITESALKSLSPRQIASQKALEKVVEGIDKFRKINDEEAFNVMQELLKRKD